MKKIRLRIPGSLGYALGAELDLPESGRAGCYALFAHCFTCSKNLKSFHVISDVLSRHGIGVMRFDFTGIGDSDGNFAATRFDTDVADIVAVAEYMSANYAAPQLIIGHSMGGTAALLAAQRIPSIRAAATIAASSDPGHVARHFSGQRAEVMKTGQAEIIVAGNRFRVGANFFKDLDYPQDGSALAGFRLPLLACHSLDDETLSYEHACRLIAQAGEPASLLSLRDCDHLLKNKADAEYVGEFIAHWASRYLHRA